MELVMYIKITVTEEILLRGYNQETYLINRSGHRDETTNWSNRGSNLGMGQEFFFLQNVLTGHGAHPISHSMGTELYAGDKAART
jgi:hypothetical protein